MLHVLHPFLVIMAAEHEIDVQVHECPGGTLADAKTIPVRELASQRVVMHHHHPQVAPGRARRIWRAPPQSAPLLMLPTTPTSRGFHVSVPGTTPCAVFIPTKVTPGTVSTGSKLGEMYRVVRDRGGARADAEGARHHFTS